MPTHTSKREDESLTSPHSTPTKTPGSRLKHWYVVAAIGLLNAVLLVVVLNLVLYAILRVKHPSQMPVQPKEEQHFAPDKLQAAYPGWKEDDVKALISETPRADHEFEYEPLTGFRERPYRGRFVNVDPAGFRYSRNQAPWPPRPGVTNLFIFGGSTAFGYYLPDDQTIPSYLQECAKTAVGPVAVYNFARPAYISSQELVLFQQLLRAGYVPQVAIFIDGLNDFILADGEPKFTNQMRSFMNGEVETNPLNDLPMIRAAHWLAGHFSSKPAAAAPAPESTNYSDPTVLQGVVDRWRANKKMIQLTAAGYGIRTVFVWQPVPMYKYDLRYHFFLHSDAGFAGYIRAKYGYAMMDNVRTQGELGPDVLWLADMQQDKHENLYVDSVHYSAAFSKEIAGRICEFLSQQPTNGK